MAAALRRQGGGLLGRLARLSSTAATPQQIGQQPVVIAAEVAQLVSLRGGLTVMPPDVAAAIDEAAKGANSKAVKRRGQELSYRLRHMSRSKHRGGMHPNLSEQQAAEGVGEGAEEVAARQQGRGKRRQSRAATLLALTRSAPLPVSTVTSRLPKEELKQLLGGHLAALVSAEQAAQAAAVLGAAAGRSSIADGGSLYDTSAALAYAAARLPACYAALHRALGEVRGRRPGWRPTTQLDFGAGPGTAVWAAQQVWPESPLDALAVEPANAMAWLGNEIQQRQREQYEAAVAAAAAAGRKQRHGEQLQQQQRQEGVQGEGGRLEERQAAAVGQAEWDGEEAAEAEEAVLPMPPPRLRWMYKLPPRYRAAQGRRYDLVTAGYVMGELKSDQERRRLVDQLWERTSGVLLLVEPGTPSGAAYIQQARTQLLALGAKDAADWEQQRRGQQAQGHQRQQHGQGPSSGGTAVAAAQGGAHVVAPCPHDGACPMEGRTSWCHFVQRFQRTNLQRAAKATAGIQPRTYQDERFSYIAIARGPRPAAHRAAAQPAVAGSLLPNFEDPQDYLQLPTTLRARHVPADALPMVMYSDSEGEGEGEEGLGQWQGAKKWKEQQQQVEIGSEDDSSSSSSEDESSDSDSGSSSSDTSSSEEDSSSSSSDSSSSSSSGSESDDESSSVPSSGGSGELAGRGPPARHQELSGRWAAGGGSSRRSAAGPAGPAGPAELDEATRKLLLQSVLEGADEEDDEDGAGVGAELAARLDLDLTAAAAAAQQQAASATQAATDEGGKQAGPWVMAPMAEGTIDVLMAGGKIDWEAQEPAAVAAALAASGGWSRVIREPRKRSGHVVLDICSAAGPGNGSDGRGSGQGEERPGGVLLRQVVSRAASRREAGGTAAYRLARHLRWGDLWPADYQGRFNVEEPPGGHSPEQDVTEWW